MSGASAKVDAALSEFRSRSRVRLATRMARLRSSWLLIAQATIAAVLAFVVARDVIGHVHPLPFFAPIAAIATVATSLGNRMTRSFEMVLGNAVGILLADGLVSLIGTGALQMGLVVFIALASAVFLRGGPVIVMQSASAAILIATTMPPTADAPINVGRFVDALVGGGVGLLVSALLLPLNPVRLADRSTRKVVGVLARGYRATGAALATGDHAAAEQALAQLRAAEGVLTELRMNLEAGEEAALVSPLRWAAKGQMSAYVLASGHLGNAFRNLRVLSRQATILLDRGESVPPVVSTSLDELATATESLLAALAADGTFDLARSHALHAVELVAPEAHRLDSHMGLALVTQVRLSAGDLLLATGMTGSETALMIRAVDAEDDHLPS